MNDHDVDVNKMDLPDLHINKLACSEMENRGILLLIGTCIIKVQDFLQKFNELTLFLQLLQARNNKVWGRGGGWAQIYFVKSDVYLTHIEKLTLNELITNFLSIYQ